jgi:hypothetical protein
MDEETMITRGRFLTVFVFLTVVGFHTSVAQGYAGDGATMEPTMLIDKPTAGMLKRAGYSMGLHMFQRGGVLKSVSVGLMDRFSFGISYGGTDVIGQGEIDMNPYPGINVKLRIFDESLLIPAIAIGYDTQGKEPYLNETKRYTIKSPGFYVVASKNYSLLGHLSFHGGFNLSRERDDGDKDLNLFAGIEKTIGKDISLLVEYDRATNDDHHRAVGRGRGYLNAGLRWSIGSGLVLGFDLKNVIKNQQNVSVGNRTIQIDYVGVF